ncbi:MAG TPA: BlaI/MecI/CopY family transcriptional regulator [Gammaproteobacteria bacterium]|nr:BlaI/MecI/CopY family transcriptional regulator [Xanthomonadales bacterium]MCB1593688.1 BlaI/MecI/CopY family transcriptional regulator [Xanthomonadales bacterium]HOP21602.1 BlaI/MecI/CopY family transcriptional regulator [Gammaproteobacteria bacterium]HPI95898.1 BlaI/MecI/CopY family transcriptional regulator [Gammaproteobacteria bacterium]HPQ87305.1 BlaI/MecI/CopY family transcriptional regulator [Gammaproteobacteria bacterium]
MKNIKLGPAQREQQLLDLLYKNGPSTAKQLEEYLNKSLSNSTIRTILRILEDKQLVVHSKLNREYVYAPKQPKKNAIDGMFGKIIDTFFSGSSSDAMATFIDRESENLSAEELKSLLNKIQFLQEQKEQEK